MTEINHYKRLIEQSKIPLRPIITLEPEELQYLITTIESLQKQNGNLKESWDEQKEEIRSMRHALSMANEKNGGDYYAWMPFEENHLETLSCPVLIEADWIRQLISLETKPLKGKIESQKEMSWQLKFNKAKDILACDMEEKYRKGFIAALKYFGNPFSEIPVSSDSEIERLSK